MALGVRYLSVVVGVPWLFARQAQAKYCLYQSEEGYKRFYCNSDEYCCDKRCCEHQVLFGNFYRLWYFWICILLLLLFCSGLGYWYKRRYIHQRFIFGQSPSRPVVTMTANSTTSSDGTCSRIPTGMTINSSCCHGNGYAAYSVAPGYAGAYATNQGVVQITPKGTVYYHAAPCNLPPSYESVFRIDNRGNPVPIMEDSPLTEEPDLIRTTRTTRTTTRGSRGGEAWPQQEPIRSHQVMSVSSQHSQPIRGHHSPSRALPCGCSSGRASLPAAE